METRDLNQSLAVAVSTFFLRVVRRIGCHLRASCSEANSNAHKVVFCINTVVVSSRNLFDRSRCRERRLVLLSSRDNGRNWCQRVVVVEVKPQMA